MGVHKFGERKIDDLLLNYWEDGECSAELRVDGPRVAETETREAAHLHAAPAYRLESVVQ